MIASQWYMVVFRIVHIGAGVLWVGSVFLFVVFVQPSAAAIAPAGAPFMGELLGPRKLVDRLVALGVATVIGGLFVYWHDWHEYDSFGNWLGSAFGITLTIGALAAIAALAFGVLVTRPNVIRFLALGREAAAAGGPPAPEVAKEMAAIQARLKVFARLSLGLLIVAVVCMASARYV